MATPVTLKKMEEAKQKAMERKANRERTLHPLTNFAGFMKNYSVYASNNVDFTSDNARGVGRQYTSFEQKKSRVPRQPRKPVELVVQEVVEAPLGMGTDDYIIDSKSIVCFNGKDHFLSNLSPSTVVIDGHEYQSVEHYYQACKLYSLAGSEYALQLRGIDQPVRVKVAAKKILRNLKFLTLPNDKFFGGPITHKNKLKISTEKIDEWKATQGFIMLNHAMVHKFLQNLELREKLMETDDAILAHAYERDSFYACGMDQEGVEKWAIENEGKVVKIPSELTFENAKYFPLIGNGKNIVGAMCMKIRKMIVELTKDKQEVTVDKFLPSIMSYLKISDSNGAVDATEDVKPKIVV